MAMNKSRANRVRQRKYAFQKGLCWLCGRIMSLDVDQNHPHYATFDHVVPLHDGGQRNSVKNLKLAHRECNMKRGTATFAARGKSISAAVSR